MSRFSLHELSLPCSVLNCLKNFPWQALMLISSALDKRHVTQFILVPKFFQDISLPNRVPTNNFWLTFALGAHKTKAEELKYQQQEPEECFLSKGLWEVSILAEAAVGTGCFCLQGFVGLEFLGELMRILLRCQSQ